MLLWNIIPYLNLCFGSKLSNMKILYSSSVCSNNLLNYLYNTSMKKPMYSIQKFHWLLLKGFVKNDVDVQTVSAIPISSQNHKRRIWQITSEIEDGIHYRYIPFLNFPFIRQIGIFIYSFLYTLFWGMRRRKGKRLICDVLNISVCLGSLIASKLIGLKSVGIVTDMPGLMVGGSKSFLSNLITQINKSYLSSFDYYVFLTEQMNLVLNIHKRPYIVMEGLVDVDMQITPHAEWTPDMNRNIIYAGGLYEQYGVKMLIEAFMQTSFEDVSFSIYGMGEMEQQIKEYEKKDPRIHYYGAVPNSKVVEEELKATLLINPRPTHEEFTQYSFPSKNMEYMVSGTPVLTTKLPGMPVEYYPYVFLFDEETVEGYKKKLDEVLLLSNQNLSQKGQKAKRFVLDWKNNIKQALRIKQLINFVS